MPAEWAPHDRCWMAWPCYDELWGEGIDAARRRTVEVARAIAKFEPVAMIARPGHGKDASALCCGEVDVLELEIGDSWTRDTAPTFLVDGAGRVAGCDWQFNAWGKGGETHSKDALLAKSLLQHLGLPCYSASFVLEGGAIHSDGRGTVLTTEPVVLDRYRNPALSRGAAEALFKDWLGAEQVIWLPYGLSGDDTGGHVDNVACFAPSNVILAAICDDPGHPDFVGLQSNLELLKSCRDFQGRPFDVRQVPLPRRQPTGIQVLSYINFYVANGGVIMPSFDDPQDDLARTLIADAFPGRQVLQIPALDLCVGGGGIHCVTQQQPAG